MPTTVDREHAGRDAGAALSRTKFELAGPEDDAELRALLARWPTPGSITLTFRREPSYFGASVVDGGRRQTLVARHAGRVVGVASRSTRERFVDGRAARVGYLSELRLLPEFRRRTLLARGFRLLRRLHEDGGAAFYVTTIADGNRTAIAALTSARAGLPQYRPLGRLLTMAIPARRHARRAQRTAETVPDGELVDFIRSTGARRQLFPCYDAAELFGAARTFRGLERHDFCLAHERGRLVGCMAAWDQRSFRQSVVEGYGGLLGRVRRVVGVVPGWPRLPAPGEVLDVVHAALPLVAGDAPAIFDRLLQGVAARAVDRGAGWVLVGLHENDPLARVARRRALVTYVTRLYSVAWDAGGGTVSSGSPPYLELGSL